MKPILFNTEMVRAILEGRKTVTRRVINRNIADWCDKEKDGTLLSYENSYGDFINPVDLCRYRVGDILYVRETWCKWYCYDCGMCDGDGSCDYGQPIYDNEREEWFCYCYKANGDADPFDTEKWKPSIHMPKEAARLFLRVTNVRVERLQDMTREDMLKEGITDHCKNCKATFGCDLCINEGAVEDEFFHLWNGTIKKDQLNKYGWYANPYVWVIEFEVISAAMAAGQEA